MENIIIFLCIVAVLSVGGILFYRSRRISKTTSAEIGTSSKPTNKGKSSQLPSDNAELIRLRQHLNNIVLHNNRVYQNNIEIARKDFVKRGLQNPSETELLKRAIEIWQDDNR